MNAPLILKSRLFSFTPQSVRYVNELRALNMLFREGGMSRARLARHLGLGRSTTGNIIANLLDKGLVVERNSERQLGADYRTGRPGIVIEIDPAGATFIGAEIEADRLQVLAIDLRGEVLRRGSIGFPVAEQSAEETCSRLADLIGEVLESAGNGLKIGGLAVAVPALIEGLVVREAVMIGWRDVPLVALLRQELTRTFGGDVPIAIENDANALALAETYHGTAHRSDTVICLMIESGAGGGIVIGGKLFRGANGVAGEFGHLEMGGEGYSAPRSRRGTLESYLGKPAVVARYVAHGGASGSGLSQILDGLETGERAARATALDWAAWLARGLLHVTNVLNPGLVIIGGSVGRMLPYVMDAVDQALVDGLPRGFPPPKVELSKFGEEGPAFGCAIIMHQRMLSVEAASGAAIQDLS